jgi:hypothetical protein
LTQELEVESAGAIDCARAHETSIKPLESDTTIVKTTTAFYEALEHLEEPESDDTISYDSLFVEPTLCIGMS